jgi:hypothetical protein
MSVNIFNPLDVITNSELNNKIPNPEELMIYVNLMAYRKSKTNIIFNAKGYVNIDTTDSMNVNMMGYNPNTKKYTTKWTNNTIISDDNYEGFGITNIDIKTNSSYIPEVTIDFVDIRGMNFMNKGKKSPYSVLYDFPPPIFELTIKGYYGKPLKYALHLTKQNTRFDSKTGNYIITVKLIANIFAPLTDVLFKYAEIISLLDNSNPDINLNVNSEPKSIYELTYRLKNIYQRIEKNIKSTNEIRNIERNKDEISSHLTFINFLNSKNFVSNNKYRNNIVFYIGVKNNSDQYEYEQVRTVNSFTKYCRNNVVSNNAKLIIINQNTQINLYGEMSENILNANNIINPSDIKNIRINSIYLNNYQNDTFNFNNCLDITKAFKRVYDRYNVLNDKTKILQDDLNNRINSIVEENLGFKPTVRNIIKIICDDVDKMFKVLNTVKNNAENHHQQYFGKILTHTNYRDKQNVEKINAFPLFVEKKHVEGNCNETEVRVYPKNTLFKTYPFPETDFINRFIDVFLKIKREKIPLNIKMSVDTQGNILWIPINPMDSNLNKLSLNYSSPYFNYINKGGNSVENIIKILNERFLILSQYTSYNTFFNEIDDNYIELYSESEALNLSLSISEQNIIDRFLNMEFSEFNELMTNSKININENKNKITTASGKYVIDKNDNDYTGIEILFENQITVRNDFGTSPIDNFIENNTPNWFTEFFLGKTKPKYSKNNILIVPDYKYDENQYTTMYADWYRVNYLSSNLLTNTEKQQTNQLRYIIDTLNINQNILNSDLNNSLILLSLVSIFGKINDISISDFRSAIYDIPYFYILFVGGIFSIDYDEINENSGIIFNNGDSTNGNNSIKIMNMIDKIKSYLTESDIVKFVDEFESVLNNTEVVNYLKELNNIDEDEKNELLEDPDNVYNVEIINVLTERRYMVVNSEYTWSTNNVETYQTYSELIEDNNKSNIVNKYFQEFFRHLKSNLRDKKKDFENEEKEFYESIDDDDIKTQTYYSIKNIVDKWVRGFLDEGYPFIGKGKLIDKFVFVDRAMNDIGDAAIINAESLINMEQNIDINVFTVISRLLSQNNFEFFPLQNFMSFDGNQWEESFKIYNNVNSNVVTSPAFVCMYIGGTSSSLNTNNDFIDDGLQNLNDVSDFRDQGCSDDYERMNSNQSVIDSNVKYGEVNAFTVEYGRQNQSIFKDIEIDSKEYPETNESLAILSNLANDESESTPIPKGQNLYNLYENRAYSVKVNMLGNAMIQPTNYFELKNIPLFSGSYIVLNVEHKLTPNHMETVFNGVRILKYPNPIVTDFAKSIGMLMGINSEINDDIMDNINNFDDDFISYDANDLPEEAKYNSMHPNNDETLEI